MKKVMLILMGLLFTIQSVLATSSSNDVVNNFMFAIVKNDEKLAKSYVSSNVKIPEIRENTPIKGFVKLPSPKENVKVSITYFDDGESEPERIAFIWEITSSNEEKITKIRVVYDGSNPLMNESEVVHEYEAKFQKRISVPSEYPFDITHVSGYVYKDELMIRYRNLHRISRRTEKKITVDDLLKIANSML